MSEAKRSRSDARQFQESWTAEVFWFSVVMTESCVHSVVKMSLVVPQVLNVISKPNTKNYLEMI